MSSPAKNEYASVGEAIRFFRKYAGLSQEEVARRSDVHATWISHLEQGRVNPSYRTVEKIAGGIGLSHSRIVSLAEALTEISKR